MKWKTFLELLRAPEGETGGGQTTETEQVTDVLTGGETTEQTAQTEQTTELTPEQKAAAEKEAADKAAADTKAKAEAEMTPEQKAAAEAEAKLNSAPEGEELYEFTMPEGMEIDAAMAEKAQPLFKELGLTRAAANKLAGLVAEVRQAEAEQIASSYVEMQKTYLATAKADEEIGQKNWDTSTKQANAALQKFGTPGLIAALREHGLSNHPEMIRFAARIGLHTADDVADPGKHVDTTDTPPEERWYGKTTATTKK
jgi:hypothetical protein